MLSQNQLSFFENILKTSLIDIGVNCVLLIDLAGNIIANLENGKNQSDIYSLAALAAGNYGAVNAMAEIVGEKDFSLLFHKGKGVNIHFKSISKDYLLICIFGNDLSLGFLRLKVAEVAQQLLHSLKSGTN
jgi:predicted regulator of Ras-like GTPase activity (Roadblock/LC7/MglB family)